MLVAAGEAGRAEKYAGEMNKFGRRAEMSWKHLGANVQLGLRLLLQQQSVSATPGGFFPPPNLFNYWCTSWALLWKQDAVLQDQLLRALGFCSSG